MPTILRPFLPWASSVGDDIDAVGIYTRKRHRNEDKKESKRRLRHNIEKKKLGECHLALVQLVMKCRLVG